MRQWTSVGKEALNQISTVARFLCLLHVTDNYLCSPTLVRKPLFHLNCLFFTIIFSKCDLVSAGVRSKHAPDVELNWRRHIIGTGVPPLGTSWSRWHRARPITCGSGKDHHQAHSRSWRWSSHFPWSFDWWQVSNCRGAFVFFLNCLCVIC